MSMFSGFRDALDVDPRDEVARLRKELAGLQRQLEKRGRSVLASGEDRLSEAYDDLRDAFDEALPVVREQARRVGRTAREHQTALVVGAAVVGLLALLVSSRR